MMYTNGLGDDLSIRLGLAGLADPCDPTAVDYDLSQCGQAVAPPIAPPGNPPDSMDPCDPNSSAYDISQCGTPVTASDGSGTYTLPVQVFNSGLRYACVYRDNTMFTLPDGNYNFPGMCPPSNVDPVQVWDLQTGASVWSNTTNPSTSSPSLLNVVKNLFTGKNAPAVSATGGVPTVSTSSMFGSSGMILALGVVAYLIFGSKGRG